MTENWTSIVTPATIGALIPVLGILYFIVAAIIKHRERMALIERGMDPSIADEKQQR